MFDENLNPLRNLKVLEANTTEELAKLMSSIDRPLEFIQFVSHGGKVACFFRSDIIIKRENLDGKEKR